MYGVFHGVKDIQSLYSPQPVLAPFGLQTFQKFLAEHKNKFTRKRVIFHLSTTLNPMKRKAKLKIISLIPPIPISTTVNLHLHTSSASSLKKPSRRNPDIVITKPDKGKHIIISK